MLIVDDDKVWLRSISAFFKTFDYNVLTALTCVEGLALARRHKPDCVLLDFHLPDADGGVFCAQIKMDLNLRKTPIIIVSGDCEQECSSYLVCEADGFVMKGGPFNTIRMMVESILRRIRWDRGTLEKGDIRLETTGLTVFKKSKFLARLPLEQFRFLFILMERSPSFVSEDEVLKFISGTDTAPEEFSELRGLASRLRAKLGRQIGRRIKSKNSHGWIYVQPAPDKRQAAEE